jgi:pyridoxine 5-phosphate synthase
LGRRILAGVPRLGVNIDHVATLRQARRAPEPDPVHAAVLAELGGADGITIHLRSDRRHIQDADLEHLRSIVKTRLNVEMAATREMLRIALRVKPDQVTLVPERPEELTTEGGLNVVRAGTLLKGAVKDLQRGGIGVSLFVDPDSRQVAASRATGAEAIEINTAAYAEAAEGPAQATALDVVAETARRARDAGLVVHAGHGLTYRNVRAVAALPGMTELNIGHNIVARAVLVGMERAVREMREAMRAGHGAG